ncbi:MAG: DeoR/GlpR transcriptional regulator [Chloroflexi bacterium]|nr:DeoR/GlpR transcriptional regulator [Chloroflexota bacterium]
MTETIFPHERQQQIIRILENQQRATVAELSRIFAISEVTVRKDLADLAARRLIMRTHSGAVLAKASPWEMAFEVREGLQAAEKQRIGNCAAMVKDGETIALDSSTTALYMARHLKDFHQLTVVTNGIRIALELSGRSGFTVLMPGGTLRSEAYSLVGAWGESILRQIHIQKAFVGAKGFTLDEGLTDVNSEEIKLKRAIVEAAKEVIALIDHSKWEQVTFATFCPLERINTIITDTGAPQDVVANVRRAGGNVILV